MILFYQDPEFFQEGFGIFLPAFEACRLERADWGVAANRIHDDAAHEQAGIKKIPAAFAVGILVLSFDRFT